MHKLSLSALERAALHTLMRRRPLFKWEQDALAEDIALSLEAKGLIVRDGAEWRVTEKGARQIKGRQLSSP
jgi:hypothetical protein